MSVKLYGKMLAFSRLRIATDDLDAIEKTLLSYGFDKNTPVVIQSDCPLDLDALIDRLWNLGVAVIGVVDGALSDQARLRKLAVFPEDGRIGRPRAPKNESENAATSKNAPPQNAAPPSDDDALPTKNADLVCNHMVRSGQSILHAGGDLVITASVNTGAEVGSDCNLHIYGKGQGRLIAGATGDESARIFCQKFDPSLVSVAGSYCLRDSIPAEMIGRAVEVRFCREKGLIFTRMDA